MAVSMHELQLIYSGGAANIDPVASLGGLISTAGAGKVLSQSGSAPVNVTGVTILDAMGNQEGVGTLKYDATNHSLLWKPYGGTTYTGVVLSADGTYILGTSAGYLVVSVVYASLPATTLQDSITITTLANKLFDNISAIDSLNGDVEFRCLFLKNTNLTDTANDVRLWIRAQPTGTDTLAMALDSNGKGGTALTIANENDTTNVLSGLTFSQPSTYATALQFGNLLAGESYPFWIRRSVPANTTLTTPNDLSYLSISALI